MVFAWPVPALQCAPWAAAPAEAADTLHAESFLWQVVSPEGKVNHLFGTIHLDAAQLGQPSPLLVDLLRDSRALWLEVALDRTAVNALPALMTLPPGDDLDRLIGPELFAEVTRRLAAYGIDPATARRLRPWAVYTTLNLPPDMRGVPLDVRLDQLAREHGRPVHGLETFAEQTAIFNAMPQADQLSLLEHTLCHYERLQAETRAIVAHYRAGDPRALLAESARPAIPAETRLHEQLVTARNRLLARRMLAPLRQGGQLVAIGALHLPGADGVLAQLARKGFTLRAVPDR